MTQSRPPTEEETAAINDAIVKMLITCADHRLDIGGVIKAANAVVVRAFEYLEVQGVDEESYNAAVTFYANIATATVNFLQDGTIPSNEDDGTGGIDTRGTVQ